MTDGEPRPRRSKRKPAPAEPRRARAQDGSGNDADETVLPQTGRGYRSTRRSSKVARRSKRGEQLGRVRGAVAELGRTFGRAVGMIAAVLAGLAILALVAVLAINGVNGLARWNAKRLADAAARAVVQEKSHENLLVIGVQDKQSTGFLALRVDAKSSRVFGIAIPDGAFVEVPGQGFERIGDSYKVGPDVSMATVTNYLSVPFDFYVTVDDSVYKSMLKAQDVSGLMPAVIDTNLSAAERADLAGTLKAVSKKNVGLAPLPVRSITIGGVTYYEPQRDQIADLLFSWWGVKLGSGKQPTRVILYNGAGKPGIAGVAARALIKAGFRIVDTGNADKFNYATTQVIVYSGDPADAIRIRDILGTGTVSRKTADQDIADVIVIIGRDYATAH